MSIYRKAVAAAICLLAATVALAAVSDIKRDRLPADPGLQAAFTELAALEPMVDTWAPQWRYATPKSEVETRLAAALAALRKSAEASPENEELQLLAGMAESYSYNLDVEGSHERTVASLEKAARIAPEDYRPNWFLGRHQCQTIHIKPGMEKLLAIESAVAWDRLPATFWESYGSCALTTNMPQHVLRAMERANKLDPDNASNRAFLIESANKRFKTADPQATYDAKEVWLANKTGDDSRFTSYMFGVQFKLTGKYQIGLSDVQKGFVQFQVKAGPFPGKAGNVYPYFTILSRAPKPGETLAQFLQHTVPGLADRLAPACPVRNCLAGEAVQAGQYKAEGDGHVLITAFQSDEPPFPGLAFEEAQDLPPTKVEDKPTFFHPNEKLKRLPGTLYYLVILETADSVLAPAQEAYGRLLKTIRVD
jgi:tetratricopeptide (TPR) repeat protein